MLDTGTRIGPYEIQGAIGAGGMGEVYRARDTKLGRDVAVKLLPEIFAHDPERVVRFQREAQLLAALNHPHIAAIYGLEESGGAQLLVLELVEGETLAQRIARAGANGLDADEALAIARQVADALEAAHEKGIIHRDLKPANIAITPDGQVKVLDFGLAKALEGEARSDVSNSPTLTLAATRAGVILGTAAYMSPEQAKGRPADKRSDVWAFGCVLYEMLTGRRAFEGEDVSDTLAAVLRGEPDWSAIPPDVPSNIRTVITRCLAKDRRARIPDISVARFLMTEGAVVAPVPAGVLPAPSVPRRRAIAAASLGLAGGIALTAIGAWALTWWRAAPPPPPMRFAIVPPAAQPLATGRPDRELVISADGSHLVYAAGSGGTDLMVRPIDRLEAVALRGLTTPRVPFVSPDGRWIGFAAGGDLRKVSITGGPPITLCRLNGAPRGASWGSNDTIIFATNDPSTGLLQVSAGGGEPKVLTKPDPAQGAQDHFFPSLLPGGSAVLFTIFQAGAAENAQVAVLDLETGERKTLIRGGSHAEYVETGHIVYAAAGSLRAVLFDAAALEVRSDPVPVVEQVMTMASGAASFSVSRNGTLVYVPGSSGVQPDISRSLLWVDRQGREQPIKAPPRGYQYPRLSPDGMRVALEIPDQEHDIWIWDLGRETLTRLTFDAASDVYPVWTPDGRRIIFGSMRTGTSSLFWQAADGTGAVERLTTSAAGLTPNSISPDGTRLVVREAKSGFDLGVVPMEGSPTTLGAGPSTELGPGQRRPETLVSTTFNEINGEISPDGRWLAYQSNESGRLEIYVRPFPKVDGGRWQISTGGGSRPAWARNARELFYLDLGGSLTVVPVQTTGAFSAGNPARVFEARYFSGAPGRTYDVSPDGRRFLMIKQSGGADQPATPASMIVVLNWFEELKARVPPR